MGYIMDKNEVITLSSDDESDFTNSPKKNIKSFTEVQPASQILRTYITKYPQITIKKNKPESIRNTKPEVLKFSKDSEKCKMSSEESPEVVVLEDCSEKTDLSGQVLSKSVKISTESTGNHSKLDIIDITDINESVSFDQKKPNLKIKTTGDIKSSNDLPSNQMDFSQEIITENFSQTAKNGNVKILNKISKNTEKEINQHPKLFTEFVNYCGSLEEIPNDRTRLIEKLMKKFREADSFYIKSQEFLNLIKKSLNKVNKNNLYLIAKEVTDELSFRKEIDIIAEESKKKESKTCLENQRVFENHDVIKTTEISHSKKRTKFINKIIKKLNKLGKKIQELEKEEVDLSDEEESAYVQLQRYRERFCQIHAKLCKFTNEIPDADRIYNRKICFTESRYPAINKCIENWLNKTKRFPDFSDILKLLESQSSSLNLPSNKDSVRAIAIEIFQQVGAMLQRRRRYDLWDSNCGFLNDAHDPATSDPALEEIIKANYENRLKKENEIFQHYVELQEKERLEPEEVPDEEANHSPVDSGNEDEEELVEIENSLNKKLDIAIKHIEENDTRRTNNSSDENKKESEKQSNPTVTSENISLKLKESKNNYKNCKSLKWRLGNSGKASSENLNPELKINGIAEDRNPSEYEKLKKSEEDKNDSDLEMIAVKVKPLKRESSAQEEILKKKKCTGKDEKETENIDLFEVDVERESKQNYKQFDVQYCQLFADNVFECLSEEKKDWGKRKVFRDLTNVKRLLELHGKKKKMSDFFSPISFQRGFSGYERSSWKRRFKVSFRLVSSKDQKCALNQNEKSEKTLNSESAKDENNAQDSSERTDNKGGNFGSSHGNGGEEDNNEDENKKHRKTDLDENQPEEEEEDEEENETEEDNVDFEYTDHSNQKTEELLDVTPSESKKSPDENLEGQEHLAVSENTNQRTEEMVAPQEEMEKAPETQEEGSEMKSTNETEKSEDVVTEKMDVTEPLEEDRKSGIENNESEVETENSINESKCEEKHLEAETDLKAEVTDCAVMVLGDQPKENTATKAQKKEELNTNITPSEIPFDAETENERNLTALGLVKNCQKSEKNLSSKVERGTRNTVSVVHKNEKANMETIKRETIELKPSTIRKLLQTDTAGQKLQKKNTSASDEERVKRFLLHSPSSISITPPRKLSLAKPPSQAALQALATLRNLKGISATIVRGGKPKSEEDVVIIGDSCKRNASSTLNSVKRCRSDLPIISSVQSIDCTTPKIVTVQGNVSGFDNSWPEVSDNVNPQFNTSSIRISNVWGSLPNSFMSSEQSSESIAPGCSSRQPDVRSEKVVKKKTAKKPVEYVVLE